MPHWSKRALTGATTLAVCATPAVVAPAASAAVDPASPLVINEVYGGGGNSGATYTHDFVELYNKGTEPVDLSAWSVQYASAAGTTWSGVTPLTGTIEPGEHYLVQQAQGAGGTTPLPTPDAVGTVAMSGSSGNVALVSSASALTCAGTACAADAAVVDLVSYGGSAYAGSGPAPRLSSTTSASRDAQHTNTGDNAADFTAGDPTPTSGPGAEEPEEPPVVPLLTIPEIQGTGATSTHVGEEVLVRGVVTAAYPTGGYFGFTIQTPGSGGEVGEASDGLFVYQRSGAVAVQIGQHVEVRGTVAEFSGLTQVVVPDASGVTVLAEQAAAVTPVAVPWPATDEGREVLESMLFEPVGTYTVSNTYATNQYGEVGLAFGDLPLLQPTDFGLPGTPEHDAVVAENAARAVVLDDGASTNFLRSDNGDLTPPYVSTENPVRVGAEVVFPEPVVVDYRNNAWKLQPTETVTDTTPLAERPTFEDTRTAAPDADRLGGGEYTVASFNVLNYFTTLGEQDPACVPYTTPDGEPVTVRTGCALRGAWDAEDLARQQAKIVDAITALDASVVGLMEIENSLVVDSVADEAVSTLVEALNAEAGEERWAYVPSSDELPPAEEMDVITNAIIYQPAEVKPRGEMRVLSELSGEGEAFDNAREPIAQVFKPKRGGGEPFLVVVNHFKSKGSGEGPGNDVDEGQGLSNADRVEQATALRDWVPTVLDDHGRDRIEDTFLVGDFNAYTEEDPMQVLYAAGYVDVNLWMEERGFEREYTYSFRGLTGSLDHVLVSTSVLDRLTGADVWEINAGESVALEYSRHGYHGTDFYAEGPYRSSDHDPVVVAFTSGKDTGGPGTGGPGHGGAVSHVVALIKLLLGWFTGR
ncbi:ExeM/NucH family extracellular endonuclease [Actinotalea sp. AC32]|nr:ExeM/NucH family extracellular endonuclease [Actinotalea sp. AC32]